MLAGAHLIFGNALALSLTESPVSALLVGFASHHLGDLLPHVDSNLWPRDFDDIRDWPRLLWALLITETLIGVLILLHFAPTFAGRWALVLATSFGSLLPDLLSHTPIRYLLKRTTVGQAYLDFHKSFHFRLRSPKRAATTVAALPAELITATVDTVHPGARVGEADGISYRWAKLALAGVIELFVLVLSLLVLGSLPVSL